MHYFDPSCYIFSYWFDNDTQYCTTNICSSRSDANTGNEGHEFCEPGQILGTDHTYMNPTCPAGMKYNEEVGECVSNDLPPDTTCPDGSKGTLRTGPNGIILIECPLPYPDSNPPPKAGLDRGNIDNNIRLLEQ